MRPRLAFFLLPAAVAGCTLAPRYERPAAPAAADWVNQPHTGPTAADLGWREFFGDPRLQRLVERASPGVLREVGRRHQQRASALRRLRGEIGRRL